MYRFSQFHRLTGKFAFAGRNYKEILAMNKECNIQYPTHFERNFSTEACDFLSLLLEKDPEDRPTADMALSHPWFQEMEGCDA